MDNKVRKPSHHVRQDVCITRAPYREGRKPTAVKVYTIHQESRYLLVQGVPTVGASRELVRLFEVHGDIEEHKILDDYPGEQFLEVHFIKYKKIQSARYAKRKLDDWSFYGGVLHVCYAPEYETVAETRDKLRERRRVIEAKTRQYKKDGTYDLYQNAYKSTSQTSESNVQDSQVIDVPLPTHTNGIPSQQLEEQQSTHFVSSVGNHGNHHVLHSIPQDVDHQPTVHQSSQFGTQHVESTGQTDSLQAALTHSLKSTPYHNWYSEPLVQNSNWNTIHHLQNSHQQAAPQIQVTNWQAARTQHDGGNSQHNSGNTLTASAGRKRGHGHVQPAVQQAEAMQFYGRTTVNMTTSVTQATESETTNTSSSNSKSSILASNAVVQEANNISSSDSYTITKVVMHNMTTAASNKLPNNANSININDIRKPVFQSTAIPVTDEQLILPPPPKQRKTGFRMTKSSENLQHARVPSAQAQFPPEFDARLNIPEAPSMSETRSRKPSGDDGEHNTCTKSGEQKLTSVNNSSEIKDSLVVKLPKTTNSSDTKNSTHTGKISVHKGPVPTFIPRQAMAKKRPEKIGISQTKKQDTDQVNKELRKNALTLGRIQGAADKRPNATRKVDHAELSVNKTVKEIRKRMEDVT